MIITGLIKIAYYYRRHLTHYAGEVEEILKRSCLQTIPMDNFHKTINYIYLVYMFIFPASTPTQTLI